jgi:Holliday junction resolvase
MVNSRAKGNRAEREVIKTLKRHFVGPFERRTMGLPGPDVVAPDEFHWAIEVKDDKTVRLKHIWKPTQKLIEFWEQATQQARVIRKNPLLVVKIEGLWFAWNVVHFDNANGYDFHSTKWLFENWCEDHTL